MQNKGVFIAVLNQGWIRPELSSMMTELPRQGKYDVYISYPAWKPITNNRNKIVKKFLESGMDYLLMIDSDNVPPFEVLDLADYEKDIVGVVCFGYLKKMVIPFCLKKNTRGAYDVADFDEGDGLKEVDAVGTGCIMISRKVLQDVGYPFRNEYKPDGTKKMGLDINFCRRAQEKGYKIYCQTDYLCSHWTTMDLKKSWQTYQELKREILRLKDEQKSKNKKTAKQGSRTGRERSVK